MEIKEESVRDKCVKIANEQLDEIEKLLSCFRNDLEDEQESVQQAAAEAIKVLITYFGADNGFKLWLSTWRKQMDKEIEKKLIITRH